MCFALASIGCDSSRPVDKCASKNCDDGLDCTVDSCSAVTGDCEHQADDSLCAGHEICGAVAGCQAAPCEQDADCDDGSHCNGLETCSGGSCQAGAAPDCNDSIACTLDACDEDTDGCEHVPDDDLCQAGETCDPLSGCQGQGLCLADLDCDDGFVCNGAEICVDSVCQAGVALSCDDGVTCTTDACSEAAGGCEAQPNHDACATGELCDLVNGCQAVNCVDDADCDDGYWCNGAENCAADICQPGSRTVCDDGVVCTLDVCDETVDACAAIADDGLCAAGQVCDPAAGGCSDAPCDSDGDCADGVFCNGDEVCQAGSCQAGTAPDCGDAITCTIDSCDPVADACANQPDHGACSPGEMCDPGAGGCVVAPCATDADCDDGLFCNGNETCLAGGCAGGQPMDCDDGQACTIDSCDELADTCAQTPDDGACDNGLWCDGPETCDVLNGCQDGAAPDCDDLVGCTSDSCDEDADACANTADDGACDNGAWCDGAETCDLLLDCQAGTAPDCDDGIVCTVDDCDEGVDACTGAPEDGLCDDGDMCNGAETCDAVADCQAGTSVICDDGVLCTIDSCEPQTGQCGFTPDDSLCDDTNACTTDTCDLAADPAGCSHVVLADDSSCSDGNVCNGDEVCQGGMCRAGNPLFCNDGNPCTNNYCLAAAGCMTEPEPEGTACPDGDLCNGDEVCDDSASCVAGVALDCDDGDECSSDGCVPAEGCLHWDNDNWCDDGDDCTSLDRCQAGVCIGASIELCGDGLDNDCDGLTDPDPPCVGAIGTFVAPPPFGDDTNPGTALAPLATIDAGIQNALIIGAPQAVYVAGDNNYVYTEDLIMAPGISVLGGYSDDGSWDYDPAVFVTYLESATAAGVKFLNAAIDRDTVLDGFTIFGLQINAQGGLSTAIAIDGCSPTISHNQIIAGRAANCRVVSVVGGADPLVVANTLWGNDCWVSSQVIRVEGSSAQVRENGIVGGAGPACVGLMLEAVEQVDIRYNTISGGDADGGGLGGSAAAVGLAASGGFDGLIVEYNIIEGGSSDSSTALTAGVLLDSCAGGAAQVENNPLILGGPARAGILNDGLSIGLMADGDCPAQVRNNGMLIGSAEGTEVAVGMLCTGGAACVLEDNELVAGNVEESASVRAVGLSCDLGACASVKRNRFIVGGTSTSVVGVALGVDTSPELDRNLVFAGNCRVGGIANDQAIGLWLGGSAAEVTNNVIFGGFCSNSSGMMAEHVVNPNGQILHANVNANYINGAGSPDGFFSISNGLTLTSDGNAPAMNDYRNNIISAGYGIERVSVVELNAGADPRSFDFNDLTEGTLALYLDEGGSLLLSIAQVNALGDMQTGDNLAVHPDLVNETPFGDYHLKPGSPMIDMGTAEGAPDHDFDGETRPEGLGIDIGPDELP